MPLNRAVMPLVTVTLVCLLAACGGAGGSSGETPPPVAGGASGVQGVATPTSVSVVTAKNAQ